MALISLGQGLYADYAALQSKDQYQVYFCTDTHQIFVGASEYTKGTKVLNAEPVDGTTDGDQDRLYAYNGSLYLCTSSEDKTWLRVANINDTDATVTSIEVGEGLTTASGTTSITTTDTIEHAIPSGASTVTDDLSDQAPAFGSTFAIKGVSTDKFGHVIAVNEHTVTVPTETAVTIDPQTAGSSTVAFGSTFAAITGVAVDASNNHEIETTETIFTIPEIPAAVTYEIQSTSEGVVTLADSAGGSSTAVINGWDLLAKKSDITTVFRYKGTVTNVADLQNVANPQVGDVYQVTNGSGQGTASEYVCTDATSTPTVWEELGTTIDLSAYATTAYVENALTWKTF